MHLNPSLHPAWQHSVIAWKVFHKIQQDFCNLHCKTLWLCWLYVTVLLHLKIFVFRHKLKLGKCLLLPDLPDLQNKVQLILLAASLFKTILLQCCFATFGAVDLTAMTDASLRLFRTSSADIRQQYSFTVSIAH